MLLHLQSSSSFLKNHLQWVFVAVFRLPVVAAHGLSCPVACGILVPQAGIKPLPPSNGRWILIHWTHQGSPIPLLIFFLEYACGERKKIFFHLKCLCLLQNKHLEPFLNTGCWVGVRVSQIPSTPLLVFLPKAGNESGQASYSRISSDCLSPEGGWNFKIQISSKFPEGYNLGLSLMYFQIWYYHSFVTNWKLSPWACTMEEVGGWGEKVLVKNLPLAHRILPFLATVDLTSLAFTHFHPYRLYF